MFEILKARIVNMEFLQALVGDCEMAMQQGVLQHLSVGEELLSVGERGRGVQIGHYTADWEWGREQRVPGLS